VRCTGPLWVPGRDSEPAEDDTSGGREPATEVRGTPNPQWSPPTTWPRCVTLLCFLMLRLTHSGPGHSWSRLQPDFCFLPSPKWPFRETFDPEGIRPRGFRPAVSDPRRHDIPGGCGFQGVCRLVNSQDGSCSHECLPPYRGLQSP